MGMLVRMRMGRAIVSMGHGMGVSMTMLPCQRVHDNDDSSHDHDSKADKKRPDRSFVKNKERKEGSDKRSYCVVRAGSCRSNHSLCLDIEKYTESIGHEAQQQRQSKIRKSRKPLTQARSDDQRTQAGKYSFQKHDVICVLIG